MLFVSKLLKYLHRFVHPSLSRFNLCTSACPLSSSFSFRREGKQKVQLLTEAELFKLFPGSQPPPLYNCQHNIMLSIRHDILVLISDTETYQAACLLWTWFDIALVNELVVLMQPFCGGEKFRKFLHCVILHWMVDHPGIMPGTPTALHLLVVCKWVPVQVGRLNRWHLWGMVAQW